MTLGSHGQRRLQICPASTEEFWVAMTFSGPKRSPRALMSWSRNRSASPLLAAPPNRNRACPKALSIMGKFLAYCQAELDKPSFTNFVVIIDGADYCAVAVAGLKSDLAHLYRIAGAYRPLTELLNVFFHCPAPPRSLPRISPAAACFTMLDANEQKLAGLPRAVTRPHDLAGSLALPARTVRGHS